MNTNNRKQKKKMMWIRKWLRHLPRIILFIKLIYNFRWETYVRDFDIKTICRYNEYLTNTHTHPLHTPFAAHKSERRKKVSKIFNWSSFRGMKSIFSVSGMFNIIQIIGLSLISIQVLFLLSMPPESIWILFWILKFSFSSKEYLKKNGKCKQ